MDSKTKERIEDFLTRQFFMKHMGFHIDTFASGRIEGELQMDQIHKQQHGMAHGGVTATIADIVAGFAAYTVVQPHQHVVTAELKVSYLNPGFGPTLRAVGRVLKAGSKLVFCESEVYSVGQGEPLLIAKASATMAIIERV
jgi:uncharacterized protein (TIGR00369 family)